jgi:hypothetical protein
MKVESLVIVDQDATVNLCLDLVHTARHMLGVCFTRRLEEYNKGSSFAFLQTFKIRRDA